MWIVSALLVGNSREIGRMVENLPAFVQRTVYCNTHPLVMTSSRGRYEIRTGTLEIDRSHRGSESIGMGEDRGKRVPPNR